jgi:hypothetical protein
MTALRYDPYLWVHLAGLATVPFWLILCLLGLAVGYPTLPTVELTLVIGVGVLPILLMQLGRPFYIFSLLCLTLKPASLGQEQRQLLTLFRSWRVRLTAPLGALALVWCFLQLYQVAPGAAALTPFSPWGRPVGLAIATVGFLGANLFLQVPLSVLQVLVTPPAILQTVQPYPVQAIHHDFINVGLPVGQILPAIAPPAGVHIPQKPRSEAPSRPPQVPLQDSDRSNPTTAPLPKPTSGIQGV